ncbi:MAG: glycosyl hydrolase family 65 protein, partial [Rhodosalinus sp.]
RRHLAFRHRTLPQAREKAAGFFGLAGACYPWEVAVSGHEECEEWIAWPYHELHVTCDVARSVLWYHELSGDDGFLLDAGLEILVATTRFWAAKAERDEDGVYHIRDVAGPDESHCRSDDNAYTNNLVAHCARELDRLLDACAAAQPQRVGSLLTDLGVDAAEREAWRALADGLATGFDSATGRYEHCAGYYALSDDLGGVMGGKQGQGGAHSVPRYATQAINQPDVLMLLYLLGAPREVLQANWEYYVPRTVGTSSLGAGILAVIAARLGKVDAFLEYYRHAAGVDVDNPMGNAAKGVHLASAGAAWLAAVQGAAGITVGRDGLHISPALPSDWSAISGRLQWHGRAIGYRVACDTITLSADPDNDGAVPVFTGSGVRELVAGERAEMRLG